MARKGSKSPDNLSDVAGIPGAIPDGIPGAIPDAIPGNPGRVPYIRRFTIPAGTVLPNGAILDAPAIFFGEGASEIQAKRAARRIAAAAVSDRYGVKVGVTDLTRRTAAINKPAGLARGGRIARELPLQAEERYNGKRIDIYLGKPSPLFQTIAKAVDQAFREYPNWDMSVAGKGKLTTHQGPDYERVQWVSTEAFDSPAYFHRMAPDHKAFSDWLGVQLRGSEDWTLILYERTRVKTGKGKRKSQGKPGR